MTDKPKAAPDTVAANAARGGLTLSDADATRIANAISPALGNFNCPMLKLPMEEEPSGWARRARPEARK